MKSILAKFTGSNLTESQKEEIHAVESAWESYYAEQDAFEKRAYDSGMSGSDFRQGRDAIAQSHRDGGIIKPII